MKAPTNGAIALTFAVVLAGCSSGTSGGTVQPPSLGAIPIVSSVDQLTRPVDGYLVTPQQIAVLQKAADTVDAQCMRAFGLPSAPTQLVGLDESAVRDNRTHTKLYGFFDPANVRTLGYDSVRIPPRPGPSQVPAAQQAVVQEIETGHGSSGPITSYQDKPVPVGGCRGSSAAETGGSLPVPAPSSLPGGGPPAPLTDPRIVAADAKWSACMKGRGFDYATPWDALADPQLRPKPGTAVGEDAVPHSAKEIATATADVECKQSTNLVGIAVAVQAAYDYQYIASHSAELAQFKQQLDDRLSKAARIVGA